MASEEQRPSRFPTTEPTGGDDLLVLAGHGDRGAFQALFDLSVARVYGLIARLVRDDATAAAICQEVYVDVWRTAQRYQPRQQTALAWIVGIAHRRVNRRLMDAAGARQPAGEYTTAYAATSLPQALRSLRAVQRDALMLAYFGGHTYREVARLIGVQPGAVKGHLRDGLLRLREVLEVEA